MHLNCCVLHMPTPLSYMYLTNTYDTDLMEGMSAPRGTAPPTFDDCVQWYIEATRTSDKQWVSHWAAAAWGRAYALAVAREALQQNWLHRGRGRKLERERVHGHQAHGQARANADASSAPPDPIPMRSTFMFRLPAYARSLRCSGPRHILQDLRTRRRRNNPHQ